MCGRFAFYSPSEATAALFGVDGSMVVEPRYNIAPTQPIVVVREGDKGRELAPMRWGLLPSWVKDRPDFPLLINARAEGIAQKPSFRAAFKRRRCLVPASGFYEWQASGAKTKQPYWIAPQSGGLIAFAGLWETWIGADGGEIDTAAIVTRQANAALQPIHHRMPVILNPDAYDDWLDPDQQDVVRLATLLVSYPAEEMVANPVSRLVNNARFDDPRCVVALGAQEA